MKPLLIAAALMLVPAAASAQVAAGALPNTFDGPAPAAAAAPSAMARPAPAQTALAQPANARSGDVLREIIAGAQAGTLDYALMTDDLAARVREQESAITPLIQGLGAVLAVDFMTAQNGADLFAVTFANAATEWVIGFDDSGKVAALLFRPVE
jgi:hypothetical protein